MIAPFGSLFAILHALGIFFGAMFKSRCLFHSSTIAVMPGASSPISP
jgi:hypothetical protein